MYGSEVRSLLYPFLLLLIHERPDHGYDLIDRLPCLEVTGVEPGHVYKMLRNLERRRLVASAWVTSPAGPARRQYELTALGKTELTAWMTRLAQLHSALGACLARWEKGSGSPDGQTLDGKPGRYVIS
ncbi:MAG TPA: helix-turn-helix transcriptional regulator [Streptosporangiaceae bacterium]|jgi:poly-beta-hydroxybutyrate-responsive repressor|nr:helix-turn-helix transcriptional regulator [Streptosporangiaceae bacterium]